MPHIHTTISRRYLRAGVPHAPMVVLIYLREQRRQQYWRRGPNFRTRISRISSKNARKKLISFCPFLFTEKNVWDGTTSISVYSHFWPSAWSIPVSFTLSHFPIANESVGIIYCIFETSRHCPLSKSHDRSLLNHHVHFKFSSTLPPHTTPEES